MGKKQKDQAKGVEREREKSICDKVIRGVRWQNGERVDPFFFFFFCLRRPRQMKMKMKMQEKIVFFVFVMKMDGYRIYSHNLGVHCGTLFDELCSSYFSVS